MIKGGVKIHDSPDFALAQNRGSSILTQSQNRDNSNNMSILNPNNVLNKSVCLANLFWPVLILILIAGNVFLGMGYFSLLKEFRQTQTVLETQKTNDKILEFTGLFIEKVLKAEVEVDFDTRLKLENAVRDLGDEEILAQWSKFVGSKVEADAQEEVKNLMEMLVSKIKVR